MHMRDFASAVKKTAFAAAFGIVAGLLAFGQPAGIEFRAVRPEL
jgi:hypothetical protein